jgi:hypothetical protein
MNQRAVTKDRGQRRAAGVVAARPAGHSVIVCIGVPQRGGPLWGRVTIDPEEQATRTSSPGGALQPGGLVNIDMNTGYSRYEVPVTARSRSGRDGTCDATHLEVSGGRLRVYPLPDDDDDDADRPGQSLLVLEAEI